MDRAGALVRNAARQLSEMRPSDLLSGNWFESQPDLLPTLSPSTRSWASISMSRRCAAFPPGD